MRERANDSMEFIEHVKIDLFPDEIYVFTPKGRIKELSAGATPIDFAYSIHTAIGNACVACRINRQLSSLSEPLQSGQTVEIVTAPGAIPSSALLNIVTTGKAKSSIRHFLKQQREAESLDLGRTLLDRSLAGQHSSFENISAEQVDKVLAHNQLDSLESLLRNIGLGLRMPYIIARQLLSDSNVVIDDEVAVDEPNKQGVMIKGTEGMTLSFAN